jgi:hypothetical protein
MDGFPGCITPFVNSAFTTPSMNAADSHEEVSLFVRGSLFRDPSSLLANSFNRRLSAALRLRLAGGSDAVRHVYNPSSLLEEANSCPSEPLLMPENEAQRLFRSYSSPSLSVYGPHSC